MVPLSEPQDAILYQNSARDITLLDIPRSISLAQVTDTCPCMAQIISQPALQVPYPSTEPKSQLAKAKLLSKKPQEDARTQFPEGLLRQALEVVSNSQDGDWCLDRKLLPSANIRQSEKRKLDASSENSSDSKYVKSVRRNGRVSPNTKEEQHMLSSSFQDPVDLSTFSASLDAISGSSNQCLVNRLCYNPLPTQLSIQYPEANCNASKIYMIPPQARFFLSRLNEQKALAFSMASLGIYPEDSPTAGRGQFDFVLLDPPWQNRSVRRAAKYETMREPEPMDILQGMLGQHIAPKGLVACWITNKASVRHAALDAFQAWEVDLVEEWAWLKITARGEPVTQIDGLWRKPYEILLVGRKRDQSVEKIQHDELSRRVIVGVPDIHSRKPNLKALIEPMLPAEYRALEIFARNLTAGWWAWGDEVLKFATVEEGS